MDETPPCKTHPDAPHGFDRNASHSADRYVCECEGWEPEKMNVSDLKIVLRAVQDERYATAELMLRQMIREREEVLDSSYPDGDGYWKEAKENVA